MLGERLKRKPQILVGGTRTATRNSSSGCRWIGLHLWATVIGPSLRHVIPVGPIRAHHGVLLASAEGEVLFS